ncbi:MAG: radical SAM protein [Chloroflexi bacterium]|nr:radical SAM protein [Chloroflexota bacterium]
MLVNPRSKLPVDQRTSPPLGLAYLAAASAARGDEVMVHDMEVESEPPGRVAREFKPDLTGITAITVQVKKAWEIAAEIQEACGSFVVLGGMHPTLLPDESLEQEHVDAVVRGEGEATWLELCERLESGASLHGVVGLSFREEGCVVHNPDRPPILDVDSLPYPAYELFKMERYTNLQPHVDEHKGKSFSLLTARGCPYRCSYCPHVFPRRWRGRSPESVIGEWKHLVEDLGAREIGILDDSFNVNRQRVADICHLLIKEKLDHIPWIVINGMRANVADYEMLRLMKEAGCKRVAFGVESGNQDVLDRVVGKHLKLEQVSEAFAAAKRARLESIGFFILGLPGDTEGTMDETIDFACKLNPEVANFFVATPFPGTHMYEIIRQGGRLLTDSWDDFFILDGRARFEMDGLTAGVVEGKWREAYRRFYFRPSRLAKMAASKHTWLNLPGLVRLGFQIMIPNRGPRSEGAAGKDMVAIAGASPVGAGEELERPGAKVILQ